MIDVAVEKVPPVHPLRADPIWRATVAVLGGSTKVAGLGDSPEEALTALVEFLAGAVTAMDPDYELPRRPR